MGQTCKETVPSVKLFVETTKSLAVFVETCRIQQTFAFKISTYLRVSLSDAMCKLYAER